MEVVQTTGSSTRTRATEIINLLTEVGAYYIYIWFRSLLTQVADLNATEDDGWALHEPDPADYFPPHLRREFLLSDGSRTIVSSRNLTASYDDAIFYSVRNGTVFQTHVVKELLHFEKRLELQDPALKDSSK
jgi:hypothetical protein